MSARDVVERLRKRRSVGKVDTPEGAIYVRGLSGRERAEYYADLERDQALSERVLADQRLLSVALCDEKGEPLFETPEAALEVLKDWSTEDVLTAGRQVLKLSGMGKDAIEEAEKNS